MNYFSNDIRPMTLSEVVGQSHLMEFLNKIIETRKPVSLILYGKPGIGKSSIANALCNDLKVDHAFFNAATGNKDELLELIRISTVLIIDEIHRMNKDKQDILLPLVEKGKIVIIGTTTENPYFVINPAVRSRMHILELKDLSVDEIVDGLKKIILKHKLTIKISDKNLKHIAQNANGDFRYCINVLDLLVTFFSGKQVTEANLKMIMPSIHISSDKDGDSHYDLLSAFHKSLRGSDVDASLYYLARLITSGDILGMERRMLCVAYEDISLADPEIAPKVIAAIDTAKRLGFPEARLPLSHAVILMAQAPKSNSSTGAINKAMAMVANGGFYQIPAHLQDAHYAAASKLYRGIGYQYPHDFDGYVEQQYLPDEIKDVKFYTKKKADK